MVVRLATCAWLWMPPWKSTARSGSRPVLTAPTAQTAAAQPVNGLHADAGKPWTATVGPAGGRHRSVLLARGAIDRRRALQQRLS